MPGTDSNSGRCSLLYHSLNSGASLASISTYTMKIARPLCAMSPSPLCSVTANVRPRLVGTGPQPADSCVLAEPGPATHEFAVVRHYRRGWPAFAGHDTWVSVSAGRFTTAS